MPRVLAALIWALGLMLTNCVPEESSLSDQLFQRYYETFRLTLDSATLAREPDLAPAYEAYLSADFATVERLTTQFIEEEARFPLVMFAQTVAFTELGRYEEAAENFAILAQHPVVGADAQWYQALVELKLERLDLARQTISDGLLYHRIARPADARAIYEAIDGR